MSMSTNFTRLSIKHDNDARINMYYLKDQIARSLGNEHVLSNQHALYIHANARTVHILEKLDALAKMRKHSNVVVFM